MRPARGPTGALAEPRGALSGCLARLVLGGRISPDLPDQGLPAPVAAMRSNVARAAAACDVDGLQRLALEGSRPFSFSFGGVTGGPADHWRKLEAEGDKPLEYLLRVFAVPHGTQVLAPLGPTPGPSPATEETAYVWPAAATREVPTDADWAALERVYPKERVARMKEDSARLGIGYLGWRAGITASGDWIFFVQGD